MCERVCAQVCVCEPPGLRLLMFQGQVCACVFRVLGRSWALLGRCWAPKKEKSCKGAAVIAQRVAPPRDFLRKFLPSRDLKSLLNIRDVRVGPSTRRAALGAADYPERAARNTAAPSQGSSVCRVCLARVHRMCYTMVSEVVRELLGFPLGCRRFFVGFVGGT